LCKELIKDYKNVDWKNPRGRPSKPSRPLNPYNERKKKKEQWRKASAKFYLKKWKEKHKAKEEAEKAKQEAWKAKRKAEIEEHNRKHKEYWTTGGGRKWIDDSKKSREERLAKKAMNEASSSIQNTVSNKLIASTSYDIPDTLTFY